MELRVKNHVIDTPIDVILNQLREELHYSLLKDISSDRNYNITVTCPIHKHGKESHPSCNVYTNKNSSDIEYGKVHCFTCGYTASLPKFVADCFREDLSVGEDWLVERFGVKYSEQIQFLPEITIENKTKKYLDESYLEQFMFENNYMYERQLTRDVINKFKIGFDKNLKAIVFPVWDVHGNLLYVTKRSINSKRFYIPENVEKPVYLLNYVVKDNIDTIYLAESQINALTLQSWGYNACGLFGTGSAEQYKILNKSGIRHIITCFDGDEAGDKGRDRLIKNINKDIFLTHKILPRGYDVNDLTKNQFDNLKIV